MKRIAFLITVLGVGACSPSAPPTSTSEVPAAVLSYFDSTWRDDVLSGGVKMVPITRPKGNFKVWTKRVGNNPRIKVLLLHGGPGATHEYFEAFDSYFPKEGIEYYYYDQLGSAFSDQPKDPSLYLQGHSWGGMLAMEYALKYQSNLKGLIVSNMMASIPACVDYAQGARRPRS
jgi:proline iminopeptidase